MTPAEYKVLLERTRRNIAGEPISDAMERAPRKRGMNGWESEYAALLETRKAAGLILSWAFEPVKLRLADGAYYKPDFAVVTKHGEREYHEVKGFFREAAKVRFKVAAELHPERFIALRRSAPGVFTVIMDLKKGD